MDNYTSFISYQRTKIKEDRRKLRGPNQAIGYKLDNLFDDFVFDGFHSQVKDWIISTNYSKEENNVPDIQGYGKNKPCSFPVTSSFKLEQRYPLRERTMVRYGEYSPRNPNILSPGKPLLGLGEYEEKRRQLLEQKKREYREQMSQVRVKMNTRKNTHGLEVEPILFSDGDSPLKFSRREETETKSIGSSVNRNIDTASTQTSLETETQPKAPAFKGYTENPGGVDGITITDSNLPSNENWNEGNMSLMDPLTLHVPEDFLLQPAKFQSLSPRERKLAELRESESYSPSFYEGHTQRGGPQELDGKTVHISQTTDQLPDARRRRVAYQEELKQQIEEKRRLEAELKEREKREEEAIMRRVEQQQERMRLEYEHEEAHRKFRQEQRIHQAEQFYHREEELKREEKHEREVERRRKRAIRENDSMNSVTEVIGKDRDLNDSTSQNLEKSLPVPALRTKPHTISYSYKSEAVNKPVDNLYESPKEINNILGKNFAKTINTTSLTIQPSYPSSNTSDIVNYTKSYSDQVSSYPTQDIASNIRRSYQLEQSLPIPSLVSKLPSEHVRRRSAIIEPEVHYHPQNENHWKTQNFDNSLPKPDRCAESLVIPAARTVAVKGKRTMHTGSSSSHKLADNNVLTAQKNILRTGDLLSEARPNNVLTQLGAFRRQMEIDHMKMEKRLQQTLQQKSSTA